MQPTAVKWNGPMVDKQTVSTYQVVLFVLVFCIGTSGCSISELQTSELQGPETIRSGKVYLEQRASGFTGGRVGWGRFTVFAIPIVPIRIQSDEASDLMQVVSNALATAGYTTQAVQHGEAGPILSAHVTHMRFNNYTWVAPIVPTWGRINVTLTLESLGGEVLWESSFEGKGTTFNFFDGYNIAATKSVTRLADSMVDAFSGPEFHEALTSPNESRGRFTYLRENELFSP